MTECDGMTAPCREAAPRVKPYYSDDLVTIYHGDAREVLPSLDVVARLIATDPPYDKGSEWAYPFLAEQAADVLTHDGALVSYVGVRQMPAAFAALMPVLRYRWTLAVENHQSAPIPGMWVLDEWKPILWFERKHNHQQRYLPTRLRGVASKEWHRWGQPSRQAAQLIDFLTAPEDLVLDPFLGGGTTLYAAKGLGRRGVGIDSDERACETAALRCSQETLGLSA